MTLGYAEHTNANNSSLLNEIKNFITTYFCNLGFNSFGSVSGDFSYVMEESLKLRQAVKNSGDKKLLVSCDEFRSNIKKELNIELLDTKEGTKYFKATKKQK